MMRPGTLKDAVARVAAGETETTVWVGFLDQFLSANQAQRIAMLAMEPAPSGDAKLDSFAGAVAEHLSKKYSIGAPPAWAFEAKRSLPEPWFATSFAGPGIREYLSWATPPEFLHRNIFTDESPLRRAKQG